MKIIAKLRHLRIAPRKVRLAINLIRGKTVEEAQTILKFTQKKAVLPLLKLLNSALANAKNNFQLESANLFVSEIRVDEGQKYKRWMPRARGQAYEIQKKTSHITLVLDEMKGKKAKKAVKAVKPVEAPKPAVVKAEKPKLRPTAEAPKPKTEKGFKRIFKRKSF